MKDLNELKKLLGSNVKFSLIENTNINGIEYDSRKVKQGYLFIALKGDKYDGASFITEAISSGAIAVLCDLDTTVNGNVSVIRAANVREIMPQVAAWFYDYLSNPIKVIAVTGTNGKTTVSYILRSIYETAGIKTGMLGTIKYFIGDREFPSNITTPESPDIHKYLNLMNNEGALTALMEVSSHGLIKNRVNEINFASAIFSNLTRDHMDFHLNRENYMKAKGILFENLSKDSFAVLNNDDSASEYFKSIIKAKIFTYGEADTNDFYFTELNMSQEGSSFILNYNGNEILIKSELIGKHNVYNILAASGTALLNNIKPEFVKKGIECLTNVPGRLQRISEGQDFAVFVDYAHTDNALENVLIALKEISKNRIITVFGCGGDRDRGKRPLMGSVVEKFSDFFVVTNDNPRTEDPNQIVADIKTGLKSNKYVIEIDREKAINLALKSAEKDDIVLIAGKGHENYQLFKNTVVPFDDAEIAKKYLVSLK